jgi:hypothetical protein
MARSRLVRTALWLVPEESRTIGGQNGVRIGAFLIVVWAAYLATPSKAGPFSAISADEMKTAISSKVFNGYARTKLPDGSFKPETYLFGTADVLEIRTSLCGTTQSIS